MTHAPLVILDRDGVINQDSPGYIKSLEEWHPIPGSIEAIAALCQAGFQVAVATNQSGIGRGLFPTNALEAMHRRMQQLVQDAGGRIATVVYCPHHPDTSCECRKPAPGLLHRIGRELGVPLDGVPFIGDSQSDIDAAKSAGCRPLLVLTGKGRATLAKAAPPHLAGAAVFADLAEAAGALIAEAGQPTADAEAGR